MTTEHDYDEAAAEETASVADQLHDGLTGTIDTVLDGLTIVKHQPGKLVTPFSDQIERLLQPFTLNIDQWVEALFDVTEFPDTDPDESSLGMLAQILTATSSDEVLASMNVYHAKDDLCGGEPGGHSALLTITGARPLRSTYEEGTTCYALVDAHFKADGKPARFTTGARAVQAAIVAHIANGWLPFDAILEIRSKPTRRGFYPLNLVSGG